MIDSKDFLPSRIRHASITSITRRGKDKPSRPANIRQAIPLSPLMWIATYIAETAKKINLFHYVTEITIGRFAANRSGLSAQHRRRAPTRRTSGERRPRAERETARRKAADKDEAA
jgi:hypothetical protein